ncbi:MAG: tetratricopeptide repeat protein, partial [Bacteroidia bacterium]
MDLEKLRILGTLLFICFAIPTWGQKSKIDSLNQLAYEGYREDVATSKAWAYQALSIAKQHQLNPQKVDSYINLSRCFRTEGNWDSAYQVLNIAIVLAEKNRYSKGLINAHNNLAACYLIQGEVQSAEPHFKKSLSYAREIDDAKGQANAYNNLAIIAESNFAYDSAMSYLHGALEVYRQISDSSGITRTYVNQAFIFELQNLSDSAIYYCIKALRIQEALQLSYQQANTHIQIGNLYDDQKDYANALKQFQRSLALFEQIGDIGGLCSANLNIGSALESLARADEALPYLRKGLQYARKTDDPFLIGTSLINLSNIYGSLKRNPDTIKSILNESIPLLSGKETVSAAYSALGILALDDGRFNVAQQWFEKELQTAEEFDNLQSIKTALEHLYLVYKEKNQAAEALAFFERFTALEDSIFNLESVETIN